MSWVCYFVGAARVGQIINTTTEHVISVIDICYKSVVLIYAFTYCIILALAGNGTARLAMPSWALANLPPAYLPTTW